MSPKFAGKTVTLNLSVTPDMAARQVFDGFEHVLKGVLMRADDTYGVQFLACLTARVIGFFAGVVGREEALKFIRIVHEQMHNAEATRRQH